MKPIIEIKHLEKHYAETKAVDGLSFAIQPGICFGLLGPNGAGKTTTIEMMEGVTEPTSGEILYKNKPIGTHFRNEAGIQFQATSLQEFLTVKETLQLFYNLYPKNIAWDELIELCALKDLLERDNKKLSGGQRQRLLLALALVNDPELVFLDEPTTGLDPISLIRLKQLIASEKEKGKTILITSHIMSFVEEITNEIVFLLEGKIYFKGSISALKDKTNQPDFEHAIASLLAQSYD